MIQLRLNNQTWRKYRGSLISENKWRAIKGGVDSKLIDFGKQKGNPFGDSKRKFIVKIKRSLFGNSKRKHHLGNHKDEPYLGNRKGNLIWEPKGRSIWGTQKES